MTLCEKFAAIEGALNGVYVDRSEVIRGVLTALVSRQNVLMFGPPGVAKSAIAKSITDAIEGGKCFTKLLTRTTTPEEIWGPIDLIAFDQGKFQRKTDNYLPNSHLAFLDEIWRGSSAILNGLLTAINERQWEDDGKRKPLALRTVIGASNSLPESDDLGALFDRFALRYFVGRLDKRSDRKRVLNLKSDTPEISKKVTLEELDQAHDESTKIWFGETAQKMILDIWDNLDMDGLDVSERRWRQMLTVFKANAWLDGRQAVDHNDMKLLCDSAWDKPTDRHKVQKVVFEHSMPSVSKAVEIYESAKAIIAKIPKLTSSNAPHVAQAAMTARKALNELIEDWKAVKKDAGLESGNIRVYGDKLGQLQGQIQRIMQNVVTNPKDATIRHTTYATVRPDTSIDIDEYPTKPR